MCCESRPVYYNSPNYLIPCVKCGAAVGHYCNHNIRTKLCAGWRSKLLVSTLADPLTVALITAVWNQQHLNPEPRHD